MLQQTALRRKLGFFGHAMQSDGLEKGIMLAFGDGRRRRGRPRRTWMDEIHEVTGMKLAELRDSFIHSRIYKAPLQEIYSEAPPAQPRRYRSVLSNLQNALSLFLGRIRISKG